MQSLKYTNFLLTVIAICLIYQCAKFGAVPITAATAKMNTAPAVTAPTKVQIVGVPTFKVDGVVETSATVKGAIPVTVTNTVATSSDKPQQNGVMKVEVTNSQLPVQIADIERNIRVALPVMVDDIDSGISNKLPVDIQAVGFAITGELPVRVNK